ncbi:hypothetical protein [Streptomyces albicerus]|jgi:hypothetical protein|nr:hypothetical protein [Streptomyces albicerus]
MNIRRTWSLAVGALILAAVVVLFIYGEQTGVILGRIGLNVF